MEGAESPGHVENFVQLIRHLHPECNSSIRMAKELAMIQFSFIATCHQVNCVVIFIYFFLKLNKNLLIGSTSILHDSEFPIDVGHCTDPGCYSRAINYNASSKQMKTLAELSSECHQSIKVNFFLIK